MAILGINVWTFHSLAEQSFHRHLHSDLCITDGADVSQSHTVWSCDEFQQSSMQLINHYMQGKDAENSLFDYQQEAIK